MHQCDSVIHLQLTVHPTYSRTVLAEICDNGTYTFQGEELTLSGFYTDTLTSLYQCDSVVNLQLTVQPTYYANMDETLCQNESFPLGGNEFTQSGNYHVEMQSVHGCDSIVDLHLTVYPVFQSTIELHTCYDSYIVYNGQTYTEPGYHNAFLQTVHGCDSIITLAIMIDQEADADFILEPGIATIENHLIRLSDHSRHNVDREWYVDNTLLSTEGVVYYNYPLDRDSVPVTLVAINALGCNDTLTQTIYLQRPSIWAPNAFTPEEATNNLFCIKEDNMLTEEVFIYTRTGVLVAQFDGMTECWDGKLNGQLLPQGVYVYLIRYTTTYEPLNPLVKKGTILLLR